MTETDNRSKRMGSKSRGRTLRVADIMATPGALLHPDHELLEAETRLERAGLSLLPVVDGDEVVGILTDEAVRSWRRTPAPPEADGTVADYMSASLPICRTEETLDNAAKAIEQAESPGLLVIDAQDQLVGVITREMLADYGHRFAKAGSRRTSTCTPHAVKSAARARGEPHGWLKSYSVKPQVRR